MQITVRVKQAGRKRALIENQTLEIEDTQARATLKSLLEAVVAQQVAEFNAKSSETDLLSFLSNNEIARQAENGKVGFGSIYNENKAVVSEAQTTALQAFEDGMFAVFVGDDEIKTLDAAIDLRENPRITFVRLTFLAGSFW